MNSEKEVEGRVFNLASFSWFLGGRSFSSDISHALRKGAFAVFASRSVFDREAPEASGFLIRRGPSQTAPLPSFRWRKWFIRITAFLAAACAIAVAAAPALAQDSVFTLNPAQTKIEFSVDTTLHTVHGTFQLKSGTVRFDPSSGNASGSIVVDASSGDSSNSSRDKKMHDYVLEVAQFPEVTFAPARVQGSIAPQGTSQVNVLGKFRLHGQDHDLTLTFTVQHGAGNQLLAETQFDVPFIDWGLKDPGNFFLHVNKIVHIHISASGQLTPAPSTK